MSDAGGGDSNDKIVYEILAKVDPKTMTALDQFGKDVKDSYGRLDKAASDLNSKLQGLNKDLDKAEESRHRASEARLEKERQANEQRIQGFEKLRVGVEGSLRSMVLLGLATSDQTEKLLRMGAAAEGAFMALRNIPMALGAIAQGAGALAGVQFGAGRFGPTYTFKGLANAAWKYGGAGVTASTAASFATAPVALVATAGAATIAAGTSAVQMGNDIYRHGFRGGSTVGSWRERWGGTVARSGLGGLFGADAGISGRIQAGEEMSQRLANQLNGRAANNWTAANEAFAQRTREDIQEHGRGATADRRFAQWELEVLRGNNERYDENRAGPGVAPNKSDQYGTGFGAKVKKTVDGWVHGSAYVDSASKAPESFATAHSQAEITSKQREILLLAEKEAEALKRTLDIRRQELEVSKAIAHQAKAHADDLATNLGMGTRGQAARLDRLYERALNNPNQISPHILQELFSKNIVSPSDKKWILEQRQQKGHGYGGFAQERAAFDKASGFADSGRSAKKVGDAESELDAIAKLITQSNKAIRDAGLDEDLKSGLRRCIAKFLGEKPKPEDGKVGALIQQGQRRALMS